MENIRETFSINKKDTFYQKRVLNFSPPLVQIFFKNFYNKLHFVNISSEGVGSENRTHFLSR